MNALANEEVGKFIEKYFVSAHQRVGTFRIVGKNKQGGNVAAYFCAPDGRVLHAIAGPVNASTMLKEAKWVVETAQKAMVDAKGDGAAFKSIIRKAHAGRVRSEHGLVVQASPVDFEDVDESSALTYRDPSGRPLAPKLPPTPVDGPDVKFRGLAAAPAGGFGIADRAGRRWAINNQGRVHMLLAAHGMATIEKLYGSVFEGILGERISTRPVEVVTPFPWHGRVQVQK